MLWNNVYSSIRCKLCVTQHHTASSSSSGVGNLFPWNAFITASNYYAERFAGTSFEDSFENYFSISFNIFQTLGLALSLRYGSEIRLQNKIIWPFFCYSLIFVLNTVLVVIVDINPNVLFGITLLSSALAGCCGSVLSGMSCLSGRSSMLHACNGWMDAAASPATIVD